MYACKKSEPILISEIQYQLDGLPFGKLFHKITRLRSELLTLATDSEQGGCAASRRALYDGICLNAFLVGIRDPLRTVIRARNPSTIEQAHEWCQAEQSFMYQRQSRPRNNYNNNFDRNRAPPNRPQDTSNDIATILKTTTDRITGGITPSGRGNSTTTTIGAGITISGQDPRPRDKTTRTDATDPLQGLQPILTISTTM